MSITKGFEERRAFPVADGPARFYWDDVGHLLRHARELEAMLKKHEWAATLGPDRDAACPECGEWAGLGGKHAPDCQLAKLLEGVE